MSYKGLRYSDTPTTNQKVVGSNPAGLTMIEALKHNASFFLLKNESSPDLGCR